MVLVCPARPRRRPPAPRPGPLVPSGALHTSGAVSLACGLVRVVTNVVNPRSFSCGFLIRCYKRRQSEGFFAENGGFWLGLTTFVIGVFVRRFELRWFDDVCNVGCPLVARPGPVATAQVSRPDLTCRIAETAPNFARNSPATLSYIEFRSLELQRFLTMLKLCSIELRATFLGIWPCLHPRVPQQASAPASQFRMQFLCGCFMR